VITGATRVDQVRENIRALEVLPELTPDVLSRIDAVAKPCVDRD
jgi:aryl-alcohol dehydrogenase-like predicted oxidoreductase